LPFLGFIILKKETELPLFLKRYKPPFCPFKDKGIIAEGREEDKGIQMAWLCTALNL
jgi:hypothetical protein